MEKGTRRLKIFAVFILGVLTAVIWYAVFHFEGRQNLLVTFLDVGQGDAAFIEAPNGNQVLIDGGPNEEILSKLGKLMPFWDRSIDLVVLTHPNADHLDGLVEVLKRYRVGLVLETGVNYSIPEYAEWERMLKEKNIKVVIASAGQKVRIGGSTDLAILMPIISFIGQLPKNINEAMVVAKLNYGSTSVLFTGDADKSLEYQMLLAGDNLKSDILKVGHHGSKTSTSEDFLKAVAPKISVISVGRKNRYGHPNQEVLDRLVALGTQILRTDLGGDISLASDGWQFFRR